MRILKTNSLKLFNPYLIDSPQPSNLNYHWNFSCYSSSFQYLRSYSSLDFSLKNTCYLGRNLKQDYPIIVGGEGNYLYTADGRKIFDGSTGAAVSCLGHNNRRIIKAMKKELKNGIPYIADTF